LPLPCISIAPKVMKSCEKNFHCQVLELYKGTKKFVVLKKTIICIIIFYSLVISNLHDENNTLSCSMVIVDCQTLISATLPCSLTGVCHNCIYCHINFIFHIVSIEKKAACLSISLYHRV
jgi:hypothetical protein